MPAQTSNGATAPVIDLLTPEMRARFTRVERGSKITLSPGGVRAPYGSGYVTTGSRPVGSDNHEDVIVVVDGSTRIAFPQTAVLTAILYGVLPRDVVEDTYAALDKAHAA